MNKLDDKIKVADRLLGIPPCEVCDSQGFFLSENTLNGHIEIQRCDTCQRFSSDIEAWKYAKPYHTKRNFQVDTKKAWYKRQITGLFMIMDDADDKEFMVSREYVKEKLKMILNDGINFHPTIKKAIGLKDG